MNEVHHYSSLLVLLVWYYRLLLYWVKILKHYPLILAIILKHDALGGNYIFITITRKLEKVFFGHAILIHSLLSN
jgi:hypothetical protein